MKRCNYCQKHRPLSDFGTCAGGRGDGYQYTCRDCQRIRARVYREANKDVLAAKRRAYYAANREDIIAKRHVYCEANPEKIKQEWHDWYARHGAKKRAYGRDWQRRNPIKHSAHSAVFRALQSGVLVRPATCEGCAAACKPQAHHDDYQRPLDVRWLCARCHGRHHANLDAAAA